MNESRCNIIPVKPEIIKGEFALFLTNTDGVNDANIDIFGWLNEASRESSRYIYKALPGNYNIGDTYSLVSNGVLYSGILTANATPSQFADELTALGQGTFTVTVTAALNTYSCSTLNELGLMRIVKPLSSQAISPSTSSGYIGSSLVQVDDSSLDYNTFMKACTQNPVLLDNMYIFSEDQTMLTKVFDFKKVQMVGDKENDTYKSHVDPYQNMELVMPRLPAPENWLWDNYSYLNFTLHAGQSIEFLMDYSKENEFWKFYTPEEKAKFKTNDKAKKEKRFILYTPFGIIRYGKTG